MLYQDRIIPIERIYCPRVVAPWMPQATPAEDLALQRSLELVGQLANVLVLETERERFALISGRRRYEAARALGWNFISVKLIPRGCSGPILFSVFLAENLHRLHLPQEAVASAQAIEEASRDLLSISVKERQDSEPGPRRWPYWWQRAENDEEEERDV